MAGRGPQPREPLTKDRSSSERGGPCDSYVLPFKNLFVIFTTFSEVSRYYFCIQIKSNFSLKKSLLNLCQVCQIISRLHLPFNPGLCQNNEETQPSHRVSVAPCMLRSCRGPARLQPSLQAVSPGGLCPGELWVCGHVTTHRRWCTLPLTLQT